MRENLVGQVSITFPTNRVFQIQLYSNLKFQPLPGNWIRTVSEILSETVVFQTQKGFISDNFYIAYII